jgi:hypothetical protein
MTRTPTVATLTGVVDLINPDPATITPEAIAHHLGQQNRYAGALELPLSVAQHSILQLEIFRRLYPTMPGIYALLDDAHEYVWGNIIRPAQEAYEREFPGFRRVRQTLNHRMDQAIRARFGLPNPSIEICAALKDSDNIAFATEWHCLMPKAAGPCPISTAPMRTIMLKPLTWAAAADAFREALTRELALFHEGEED